MQERFYPGQGSETSAETSKTAAIVHDLMAQSIAAAAAVLNTDAPLKQNPFKFHITYFEDFAAKSLTTETLSLYELRERVLNASRHEKKKLPWLKLAVFGSKRTDKSSLRNDENVQEITGIELDYDEEKISFDDALKAMGEIGIHSAVYTSPSHSLAAPHWRIVAPTSQPCANAMREVLLKRLNGYLKTKFGVDKVASGESFTLSQSYYYGWVCDAPKPDHRAEVIAGDFIDHRLDLQQCEANGGKPTEAKKGKGQAQGGKTAATQEGAEGGFDGILNTMGDGDDLEGFNKPLSRAVAAYVTLHQGHPFDKEKLKTILRDKINAAPKKPTRPQTEIDRYLSDAYLDAAIASAECKFVGEHAITLDDFVAVMATGLYLFRPTREMWPAKSVNACIPPIPVKRKDGSLVLNKKTGAPIMLAASTWLNKHQRIEQITWAPGYPEIIKDRLVADGGWIERKGVSIFNLYRPSTLLTDDDFIGPIDIRPWSRIICRRSIPRTGNTSPSLEPTECSAPRRRSTTGCCSAARKASARTPCWSPSSMRSALGIFRRSAPARCSAASMATCVR
jgi:hypothetical protein